MAEAKLNKARQPTEKRAAGPVGAIARLEQEPTRRKQTDRLRDAEINKPFGIKEFKQTVNKRLAESL